MTDPVAFTSIPGSGLVAPTFAFEVNSGGSYGTTSRMILQGYITSAGSLALNTPTPCASQQQADALCGPGSMLREMYRVAQAIAPAQPIWLEAVADPGTTKASWTITVGASPQPAPGAGYVVLCGKILQIAVLSTDTPTTIAANLAAAINGYYDSLTSAMLPVTATASAAIVTLTARHAGAIMNDFDYYVPPNSWNVFSGTLTYASVTAGTGTPPNMAGAFAAIGLQKADFVVSPFADATTLSAAWTFFGDAAGRWSWNQQVYGAYWFPVSGNFATRITAGLALANARQLVPIGRPGGFTNGTPTPSWIWVAERAALEAPWLSDIVTGRVSCNQSNRATLESLPPRDTTTWDNYNARNQLLQASISTNRVNASGQVTIDKTVTAYKTNPAGSPDTTFQGVQSIYQLGFGLPYIRYVVSQEQGNKSLKKENPASLQSVATLGDIKASLIGAVTTLENQGVFDDLATTAANMLLAINPDNSARVDCYLPLEEVQPFDILAVNATIYRQFAQAA
jgi:phage tail sheath gpL-like